METIALPRGVWRLDPHLPLGKPGGFGAVFRGEAQDGSPVAVKRLHTEVSDAAHREMRLAEELAGKAHQHVIPILDSGQDANSDTYYVVMPLAEGSLADELAQRGKIAPPDATEILLAIARGLAEVPHVVHRDLKPQNVLKHGGQWKIADFGIARLVVESTSENTLKDCLSPPYAAPEQWFGETVSNATDVYALGCIAHAVIRGVPPFAGPDQAEYRNQHLREAPPPLESGAPNIDSLVAAMLRKAPDVRPSVTRVVTVLDRATKSAPAGDNSIRARLHEIGAKDAGRVAADEAERRRDESARAARETVAKEAQQELRRIAKRLADLLHDAVPTAAVNAQNQTVAVRVGAAMLRIEIDAETLTRDAFRHPTWDAIAWGRIMVQDPRGYSWSASLFCMRQTASEEYRWREISFFLLGSIGGDEPFGAPPDKASEALTPGMRHLQVAFGPTPIDDEDFDAFADRWIDLFVRAYELKLERPTRFPLDR